MTFETETTQEMLDRMKRNYEHYNPKEWGDDPPTPEKLKQDYELAKHISETLDFVEIRLLSILRAIPRMGETRRFMCAAEKLLQAYSIYGELATPQAKAV